MLKDYLPGLMAACFLVLVMAVTPALTIEAPPRSGAIAQISVDPLSPALVNPYIERDTQETSPPSRAVPGEKAYATLEVEPKTAGEPFPVVRTRFREPSSPGVPAEGAVIEFLPSRRVDPGG